MSNLNDTGYTEGRFRGKEKVADIEARIDPARLDGATPAFLIADARAEVKRQMERVARLADSINAESSAVMGNAIETINDVRGPVSMAMSSLVAQGRVFTEAIAAAEAAYIACEKLEGAFGL